MNLRTGPWNKTDLKKVKQNGLNVFSTFHCGGGSSLGYELAGYNVIGGVEIDPKMMEVYCVNHRPKFSYCESISEFNKRDSLPKELVGIDILDGSPPCSSFSMAGSREKKWGKEEKFREGQVAQVLDDLFFNFLDTIKKLQPKVVIAENVKGILQGNACGYALEIMERFEALGYEAQVFLLNSSRMGVPQRRERVFFIARQKSRNLPNIKLCFNEEPITVGEAWVDIMDERGKDVSRSSMVKYWKNIPPGKSMATVHEKGSLFGQMKLHPDLPAPTMTSKQYQFWDWREPHLLSRKQVLRLQSFPDDYDFLDQDPKYICGMSVPPFMMQRVADQVAKQWFKRS